MASTDDAGMPARGQQARAEWAEACTIESEARRLVAFEMLLIKHGRLLIESVFESVATFAGPFWRARALTAILEQVADQVGRSEVLEPSEEQLVNRVLTQARSLPQEQFLQVISDAASVSFELAVAEAREVQDPATRARALARLSIGIDPTLQREALSVVTQIDDDVLRARTLTAVIPSLEANVMTEARELAAGITDEQLRAPVVRALDARLSRTPDSRASSDPGGPHASAERAPLTSATESATSPGPAEDSVLMVDIYGMSLLRDISDALVAIEDAYSALYAQFLIADENRPDLNFLMHVTQTQTLVVHPLLPLEDALVLRAARVASPGWVALLGSLNPLETIRQYLSDRHERLKDREYRNAAERRRLELELEKMALHNFEEKLNILREAGATPAVINAAIARLVREPLAVLGTAQDEGVLGAARWISEDELREMN